MRRFALGFVLTAVGGALALSAAMLWALHDLPLDHPLGEPDKPTLLLEAADGTQVGRVGPLRLPDAALRDYPAILIQAVLSTEDHRFYRHFGVDPVGIVRAVHRNMASDGIVEGGSTITQQLAKMRYVGNDRTYTRKLREAMTAIWLEAHLGKDEILTRYLNGVYLGAGAFGMTAAARLYFDKRPADLTLPEAAMLAGLIKAPSQFNPLRHLAAAQKRAESVLDAMVATGAIDAAAAAAAKASPATIKQSPQLAQAGSWFTYWVGRQAADVVGARTGSVRLRTTLRPELQRLAQDTLDAALTRDGRRLGASQGALVAMRPNGEVLALVGGRDYGVSQFNRAVDASRQPGSAFKLFVYLAALRDGYAPDDTIDAGPVDVKGWEPENFGNERYGRITLGEAFARSVNTAAVRLAMDVGLDRVIAAARDLGIHAPLSPVPSLALGAVGVNLLDLTGAFASVSADRQGVRPWGIAAVGPANGEPLRTVGPPLPAGGTLDPYQQPLIDLLEGVVRHGTGRAAALRGFAAGKTGTSQDYRDAWFVGFNDTLVVGVWIGNDDNSPMRHVVGGGLPAAIWKDFIVAATPLAGQPEAPLNPPAVAGNAPPSEPATAGDQAMQGSLTAGRCDIAACSGAYRSFRASDCSYQPYFGGRRLCDMGANLGAPPTQQAADSPSSTDGRAAPEAADTGYPGRCNVDVCARHYSSFDASDCTYQPFDGGPRQLCVK